jgi:hypothetical protein
MTIGISLLLKQERDNPFGVARRKGHWLSQKLFRIKAEEIGTDLPIRYVGDDVFEAEGYDRNSSYVIKFRDVADLNQSLEDGESMPFEILFSESLAVRMQYSRSDSAKAVAAAFHSHLIVEIVRTGLVAAAAEGSEINEDSILGRFLNLAERESGFNGEQVKDLFDTYKHEVLRSRLESRLRLRESQIGSLT